jgi:hypothetical protein
VTLLENARSHDRMRTHDAAVTPFVTHAKRNVTLRAANAALAASPRLGSSSLHALSRSLFSSSVRACDAT